ncbi:MAG: hypothetical protein SVX38_00730 [Chloroflexota bacterium]|nr:hypothetical protein [Chloroflexota bacterium]
MISIGVGVVVIAGGSEVGDKNGVAAGASVGRTVVGEMRVETARVAGADGAGRTGNSAG